MTLEEMAASIQRGEDMREELLEQLRPLRAKMAYRYKNIAAARGSAVDEEDLMQMASIGILAAAETYQAGAGKAFIGWAMYYIKQEMRYGLRLHREAPQLVSLDAPLEDNAELCLGDTLEDEREEVSPEAQLLADELRQTVRSAVAALPMGERAAVMRTDRELTAAEHQKRKAAAFRALRKDKRLIKLWREYNGAAIGRHVGVNAFQRSRVSETEAAVFRRENWLARQYADDRELILSAERRLEELRAVIRSIEAPSEAGKTR